jgi:hypothetical protein
MRELRRFLCLLLTWIAHFFFFFFFFFRYLYTLSVKEEDKARKLRKSLPPTVKVVDVIKAK